MRESIKKNIPSPLKNKIKKSRWLKHIFRSIHLKKLLAFPPQVEIEVTSFCNAQCNHCEYKNLRRPHGHMEMNLYKKIIDQCNDYKRYCKEVSLFWIGEPLLDPTFFEKVKYAKEKKSFLVSTYSNGSLLTPNNCQKLIDSGIDRIVFGVDGATKESFESVRIGLSYSQVVEGIKRLAALKKKLGAGNPQIWVQMIVTPYNEDELDLFKKTWQGVADQAYGRKMHVWGGQTIDENLMKYSRQLIEERRSQFIPCFYLWKSMIIAQSGKVALCCIDSHVQEEIGDLNKETIYQVWQGKRISQIRKMHLTGKMNEIPICQKCNFRQVKGYPWWWYGG